MENVNCLRCHFRHEDNGNCTAVGGFCTAVQAAHCPLLREYLDTGLEPAEVERSKLEIEAGCVKAIAERTELTSIAYGNWPRPTGKAGSSSFRWSLGGRCFTRSILNDRG